MWYITTDIDSCIRKGGLGGLGHMHGHYITSYIISLIFHIQHVYYPFKHAGTTKHRKEQSDEVLDWDIFLGFGKDEIKYSDLKCEKIYLPLKTPFYSYTLDELKLFFSKYNRQKEYLFLVGNSNRVYINNFYQWCENKIVEQSLYDKLLQIIRNKCSHKFNIQKGLIVVHIRRGDKGGTKSEIPLHYYKSIINKILENHSCERLVVLSLGTHQQMTNITKFFSYFNEYSFKIEFKLNFNTIESFKLMLDCEILVGGESSFSITAGLYSDNKKYNLHYTNAHLIQYYPNNHKQWKTIKINP